MYRYGNCWYGLRKVWCGYRNYCMGYLGSDVGIRIIVWATWGLM